jgi:hypothetical protein
MSDFSGTWSLHFSFNACRVNANVKGIVHINDTNPNYPIITYSPLPANSPVLATEGIITGAQIIFYIQDGHELYRFTGSIEPHPGTTDACMKGTYARLITLADGSLKFVQVPQDDEWTGNRPPIT